MSDLDKLMSKMRDNREDPKSVKEEDKKKKKVAEEIEEEEEEDEDHNLDSEDLEEDEEDEIEEVKPKAIKDKKVEQEGDMKQSDALSIENEVGLLQNDGIFRREMLLIFKELADVHKINTQTLLDIKTIINKNAKKK